MKLAYNIFTTIFSFILIVGLFTEGIAMAQAGNAWLAIGSFAIWLLLVFCFSLGKTTERIFMQEDKA